MQIRGLGKTKKSVVEPRQDMGMGRFVSVRSVLLHFRKPSSSSSASVVVRDCSNGGILLQQEREFCSSRDMLSNVFQRHAAARGTAFTLLKRSFHGTGSCSAIERGYYEILGIPENGSQDDVKKAFHELAKEYHPDANKKNPAAKRKFQEIREAYEILRDPEKRAEYNQRISVEQTERASYSAGSSKRYQASNQDPFSHAFYHIFSEVFEDDRQRFAPDIKVDLSLSFSEAARGCTRQISFKADVICNSCYGTRHQSNARPKRCLTCEGTGRVTVFPFSSKCNSCGGYGQIFEDYCSACGGSGVLKGTKDVDVTVPAGVDSGDVIHIAKAGNSGSQGVQPGDLHIKLHVSQDPIFSRDSADIYVDVHISFTQAILGGKIEVPTLAGKKHLEIPRSVQPGQLLVLKGRGLPKHIGLIDHGDQYVRFRVHFPISVNKCQRELLEEFAKEEGFLADKESINGKWWMQIADRLTGEIFLLKFTILVFILSFLGRIFS